MPHPCRTLVRPPARSLALVALLALAPAAASGSRRPAGADRPAAVAAADTTAPRTLEELLARLRHILDSSGTPGASLAIVRRDSVLFAGGLGLARVSPARPATAATLFRVGSTSKLLIGLTALALERERRLSLQEPLGSALPSYAIRNAWAPTDTIRLIHLLEHTSGIDDNSIKAYASSDPRPLTLAEGLRIDAGRQAARWRPGTRFAYSNTGAALVALVIEQREGRAFEEVVQTRWFDRLGMRTATYFEPAADGPPLAALYIPGRETPVAYWHPFARPIGALNASALDMAALLRLLTSRGVLGTDTLVVPAALARAERSQTWIGAQVGLTEIGYGLGLYRTEGEDGRVWAGHGGGVEGGLSDLSYLPDAGIGYSLQINAMRGRALALMSAQVRAYLTRDEPVPLPPAPVALAPSIGREFAGWYRPISPRPQLVAGVERLLGLARVRVAGDGLDVRPLLGTGATYVPTDSLLFRTRVGSVPTLAFHRDPDAAGRPTMHGFNNGATYARVAAWDLVLTTAGTATWLLALAIGPLVAVMLLAWRLVRLARQWTGTLASTSGRAPMAQGAWWCAAAATAAVVVFCYVALQGFQDVRRFGTVSSLSVAVALASISYPLVVAGGLWLARRGPPVAGSRGAGISWWGARAVLMAHAIGVVYAIRYGLVGYIPWW